MIAWKEAIRMTAISGNWDLIKGRIRKEVSNELQNDCFRFR